MCATRWRTAEGVDYGNARGEVPERERLLLADLRKLSELCFEVGYDLLRQ